MKGNVFIGWSSNNSLALKVKDRLKKEDYNGVVGGRAEENLEHGVGDTVIRQMRTCSAAIMLFTTRHDSNGCCDTCGKNLDTVSLSGNMLFELGFLTGSLKIKRVFIVYIDDAVDFAPTDLRGMWDLRVKKGDKSEEEVAEEIVKLFLDEQEDSLVDVKIDLVADYYKLKNMIAGHLNNPVYYENEMAQIIIIYSRSAYLFGNVPSATDFLDDILHSDITDDRMLLAVNSALAYFDTITELRPENNESGCLSQRFYSKKIKELKSYLEDVEDMPENDPFRLMLEMTVRSSICFAAMMYYRGQPLTEDAFETQEEYAKVTVASAKKFEGINSEKNELFGVLYESYAYRNLALLYKDYGKKELAKEYFEYSKNSRYRLVKYFKNKDLDVTVLGQIETEYHLALTDDIDDVDDQECKKRIRELKEYLAELNSSAYNRRYLVAKIENILADEKKNKNRR